jgi:hypothetical protein
MVRCPSVPSEQQQWGTPKSVGASHCFLQRVSFTSRRCDSGFKLTAFGTEKRAGIAIHPGPFLLIIAQNTKPGISPFALAARTFGKKLVMVR